MQHQRPQTCPSETGVHLTFQIWQNKSLLRNITIIRVIITRKEVLEQNADMLSNTTPHPNFSDLIHQVERKIAPVNTLR